MKLHTLTLVLLSSLSRVLTLRLPLHPPPNQQRLGYQAVKPTVRNATLADVDAITDIVVDAFAPAPEQEYIFQFRDKYREYHWECQRQEVVGIIELASENEGLYINVIDAPVDDDDDDDAVGDGNRGNGHETKAVAVAFWTLMTHDNRNTAHTALHIPLTLRTDKTRLCHLHLDMNLTRALQWQFEFNPYEEHYIEQAYERQVYLALLATHPDYDGLGFGAAHCEWGKELARQWEKDLSKDTGKEEKVNVTLIATRRGYELYSTIGFENIANLSFTRVEGDVPRELTWLEVMFYQS